MIWANRSAVRHDAPGAVRGVADQPGVDLRSRGGGRAGVPPSDGRGAREMKVTGGGVDGHARSGEESGHIRLQRQDKPVSTCKPRIADSCRLGYVLEA
jgi:hypothetical protein